MIRFAFGQKKLFFFSNSFNTRLNVLFKSFDSKMSIQKRFKCAQHMTAYHFYHYSKTQIDVQMFWPALSVIEIVVVFFMINMY